VSTLNTGAECELRKVLNLVVDSAIAADDAIVRNDIDALRASIAALTRNTATAQEIALTLTGLWT
jgi:hypothetical protein